MRLSNVIGIFTLIIAINSFVLSAAAKKTKTHVSDDEKEQSQQFVMDLARNFSSFYFQKMTAFTASDRIVSPISVFIPMSMLSYGARGSTRQAILNAIGIPKNYTRMAKIGFRQFLKRLTLYDVRVKTKIFVRKGVRLHPNFVTLSTNVFDAEIEYFNNPKGSIDKRTSCCENVSVAATNIDQGIKENINEWVAAQTHNNVTELFKPYSVDFDRSIIFVNAVYFKGTWKNAFNRSRTSLRPFHLAETFSFNVPTMYTAGRFPHGRLDEFNASFIELPYKSNRGEDEMSMFIILPDYEPPKDWLRLTDKLKNLNLNRLLNSTIKEVEVYLPKFKIENELSLNSFVNGIIIKPDLYWEEDRINKRSNIDSRGRMFSSINSLIRKNIEIKKNFKAANFSAIFETPKQEVLSGTAMKIVIEVDEEGQQAAEASGISYESRKLVSLRRRFRSIKPNAVQFKVNRPAIAVIATKGKVLTNIFYIYLSGRQFIPKDIDFFEN